jgi:hypothetical protein
MGKARRRVEEADGSSIPMRRGMRASRKGVDKFGSSFSFSLLIHSITRSSPLYHLILSFQSSVEVESRLEHSAREIGSAPSRGSNSSRTKNKKKEEKEKEGKITSSTNPFSSNSIPESTLPAHATLDSEPDEMR